MESEGAQGCHQLFSKLLLGRYTLAEDAIPTINHFPSIACLAFSQYPHGYLNTLRHSHAYHTFFGYHMLGFRVWLLSLGSMARRRGRRRKEDEDFASFENRC